MSKLKQKTIGAVALAAIATGIVSIAACSSTGSDSQATENDAAQAGINLMLANQPPPIFETSAYRLELIEIEAIQALGSPTTSFFFPMGTTIVNVNGAAHYSTPPVKTCPSEGEPVPNTASLTNPWQGSSSGGSTGNFPIGLMDPNGGYSPSSSSGTYVLCDTPNGGTKLNYWEGPVYAETGGAVWNAATGTIQDIGPSALPVCTLTHSTDGDGTNLQPGTAYYHCVKA